MDVNTAQDKALAQPTRLRLFGLLSELRRATATDELAQRMGRHPNGIRLHLERLQEAGLVTRRTERRGRGRPRDLWSIDPEANPGGNRPTAYGELSLWLTRMLEEGAFGSAEIEAKGHEIGRELAQQASGGTEQEDRFQDALAAMGFQPEREERPDGATEYCLGNCPYRDVVRDRQGIICGLHRGITTGLLSVIDPLSELVDFVPKDPDRAGCLIGIERP